MRDPLGVVDVRAIAGGSARIRAALPGADELRRANTIVGAFESARARGEARALVDGLWVEVPTYRNALRLIERAARLAGRG